MARGKKDPEYRSTESLYVVWSAMHTRCENPKHNRYHLYGGRGIKVCAEWGTYVPFRDWATSSGYRKGLSIDRIDGDGHYEPTNCHWASSQDQNRNRRNNRLITAYGMTKSLAEWADDHRCTVSYKVLWERLEDGMAFEQALTTPLRRQGGYRVIAAYGKEKSLTEWAADPRCTVKVATLWKRINDGWLSERAISTPSRR